MRAFACTLVHASFVVCFFGARMLACLLVRLLVRVCSIAWPVNCLAALLLVCLLVWLFVCVFVWLCV